jgi:hypothetical protein
MGLVSLVELTYLERAHSLHASFFHESLSGNHRLGVVNVDGHEVGVILVTSLVALQFSMG